MRRLLPCRDCRRPILWTTTEAGKRLAVDPTPDAKGNTAVWRDHTSTPRPTTSDHRHAIRLALDTIGETA